MDHSVLLAKLMKFSLLVLTEGTAAWAKTHYYTIFVEDTILGDILIEENALTDGVRYVSKMDTFIWNSVSTVMKLFSYKGKTEIRIPFHLAFYVTSESNTLLNGTHIINASKNTNVQDNNDF